MLSVFFFSPPYVSVVTKIQSVRRERDIDQAEEQQHQQQNQKQKSNSRRENKKWKSPGDNYEFLGTERFLELVLGDLVVAKSYDI